MHLKLVSLPTFLPTPILTVNQTKHTSKEVKKINKWCSYVCLFFAANKPHLFQTSCFKFVVAHFGFSIGIVGVCSIAISFLHNTFLFCIVKLECKTVTDLWSIRCIPCPPPPPTTNFFFFQIKKQHAQN